MSTGPLLGNSDFVRLWTAQTLSVFGSQFTLLALPIIAVLALGASPSQMGVLSAAETGPFLILGLFAGAWVDRVHRRRILVFGDLGRALLLGTIPAAAFLGVLGISQLYIVGFLVGVCTVFFDVAYQAYLPALIDRERLVEGNSRLEASRSLAQISGPGLAGALIQILSAPAVIVIDALSFLSSAFFIWRIGRTEEPPGQTRVSFLADVREGVRVVLGHPLLRPIAGCTSTWNFFNALWFALYILFAARELGLTPAAIGVIASIGNLGGLAATVSAGRLASRFGVGRVIIGAALFGSMSAIPIVVATPTSAIVLLTLASLLANAGGQVYNINQVSLRQAIVPQRLQGRMNATMRFLVWGTIPLGALVGGFLGQELGLRQAIGVGAVGSLLSGLWVLLSPLRAVRRIPDTV